MMARIKIEDLPLDRVVTKEEMKELMGGAWTYNARPPNPMGSNAPSFNATFTSSGGILPPNGMMLTTADHASSKDDD